MKKGFRGAVVGLLAFAALSGASATAGRAETLTDTLILAYKNSNLLEQNRALLRAADEGVAQSIAALRPVLAFIGNAGYSDPLQGPSGLAASASLNLSMNVYDGGASRLAIDIAKESVLSARAGLVNVEQSVLLDAVQAYMDVLSASQTVTLGESNVRLISEQLRAAEDRFEVGEVTRTDVSLAESFLAASRGNLAAAQGSLAVAREAYKAATGQYPQNLSSAPTAPVLPASLDEARAIAVRTHPAILAAQHDVTVAEMTVARARAARGPSVSVQGAYTQYDSDRDSSSVGLQLNQTLYSGGALKSSERQAAANRDASRAALHQTVSQVEQQLGGAWANLAVTRAQLIAANQQIEAAQLAFEGTREEARLGSRTTLDVLNAEQDLLDARNARVQATTGQYVAAYQVLARMGLLTVDYLNLGIPTYDPAAYYDAVRNAPVRSVQGDKLDKVLKSIGQK